MFAKSAKSEMQIRCTSLCIQTMSFNETSVQAAFINLCSHLGGCSYNDHLLTVGQLSFNVRIIICSSAHIHDAETVTCIRNIFIQTVYI